MGEGLRWWRGEDVRLCCVDAKMYETLPAISWLGFSVSRVRLPDPYDFHMLLPALRDLEGTRAKMGSSPCSE